MSLLLAKDELDIQERTKALQAGVDAASEINTVEDFQRACRVKIKTARLLRAVAKACAPEKQKRYQAHKEATAEEAALLEPIEAFDENLTAAIVAFVEKREQEKQWLTEALDDDGDDMDAAAGALAMQVPKIDGITIGKRWRGIVDNFWNLVLAVAAGEAPQDVLMPNQAKIDEYAKASKSLEGGYPGVRYTYGIFVKTTGKEKEHETKQAD